MMLRSIKYGKIALVVFITVLIWVGADLALDEELSNKPATIIVDESATPKLWVSINQFSAVDIRVTFSGPHSAIADESRKLKEGKRLEFDFDAAQENMGKPGSYTLSLLPFLQKDKGIRRLGLKVKSCEPETLAVNVVELVEKSLVVVCVDEDGNPVRTEPIEPPKVSAFVPQDWEGERLKAKVKLTQREIEQARLTAIGKTPYIELAPGQIREIAAIVKITVPPQADPRSDYTITAATLGIILSPTLLGKYDIEVENLPEVIGPITIRATPEAKRAYEQMRYQVILEIDDEDAKSTEPLPRELIYNFPSEYVAKGEIELKQQRVTARFRLIPLAPVEASSGGVD